MKEPRLSPELGKRTKKEQQKNDDSHERPAKIQQFPRKERHKNSERTMDLPRRSCIRNIIYKHTIFWREIKHFLDTRESTTLCSREIFDWRNHHYPHHIDLEVRLRQSMWQGLNNLLVKTYQPSRTLKQKDNTSTSNSPKMKRQLWLSSWESILRSMTIRWIPSATQQPRWSPSMDNFQILFNLKKSFF